MSKNLWNRFIKQNSLSDDQADQFKEFYNLLQSTNEVHNLTAITDLESVLNDHFTDSLALCSATDCSKLNFIADVGTGGGFPGIPLKIKYSHLKVLLIEVTEKKINFLKSVINALNLKDIEICSLDWRTFLRNSNLKNSNYNTSFIGDTSIDLFCARASLQPSELLRAFKPSSKYKSSEIAYWASKSWEPTLKEKEFIIKDYNYNINNKKRRLIFFKNI